MTRAEFITIQKKLGLTNQKTAQVLGVRLVTVQKYVSGKSDIPCIVNNFLQVLKLCRTAEGHAAVTVNVLEGAKTGD